MALNWTIAQFNAFIDSIFPDNQNREISEADLRDALKTTVLRSEERSVSSEMYTAGLNSLFINRSLNLAATIYVDGVNGNDARTGSTNNNDAATGTVKTLARVAELHSGKTFELQIVIVGNVVHNADITFKIPFISLNIAASFTYAKKVALASGGVVYGDGTFCINWECQELNILNNGTLTVEGHAGSTGLGNQILYQQNQGANRIIANQTAPAMSRLQVMNVENSTPINLGNNTIFAVPGATGTAQYSWNYLSVYRRSGRLGGVVNLGTNAVESMLQGDKVIIRSYTPTSSTDANLMDTEMTSDHNFLYRKNGGVIKKIAWVNF